MEAGLTGSGNLHIQVKAPGPIEQLPAGAPGFRKDVTPLISTPGIRCWERNGFGIVGTLPGAFRHKQLGYMDAYVMVQGLVEGPAT
ncbi:hypothetical protein KBY67_14100 [Synechococcus sp. RedBA-s]|nr:hypothetical protein [Synechococcus sp. RedBA-s]